MGDLIAARTNWLGFREHEEMASLYKSLELYIALA